ncbi:MAG: ATPase [Candidatus Saccharibacteria bacterium]|nr:ATPase [Candidatus Saccharibacteria bacterium]
MASLHYAIDINAPKEKVWHAMLDPETYKQWTDVFHPGSYYDGSWKKGSRVRFVSEKDNGQSGILGEIVEHVPYEYTSIEMVGEIVDGEIENTSDSAKSWIGSRESYRFTQKDGVTTVQVELVGDGIDPEIQEMFEGMWPPGLAKLKEIAELS